MKSQIIKLNRKYMNQLAKIDFESNHQMDKESKISLKTYKKWLVQRFRQKQEIFFGYIENGTLKGYITLKPFFPGHRNCELHWMAVSKHYQGRGIGSKLVNFIEQYAKKKKFRNVCLYTNKVMIKTRKFYAKLGFKFVNEFPGYYNYKKNNTAVLYVKQVGI